MNFWSVLIISVVYFYTRTTGLIPQKLPESWKCADPKCSVPISEAKPVLKQYNSLRNLSLRKDQKVIIYGKGSKTYDVEVDGKRGHIPKTVVMETRVLVRDADLKHVVTAESIDAPMDRANRVEVNVKVSSMEPAIDIVNLTPEMPPPVMQGAFLLAGAAADSSLPKVPYAPGASSTEDDKIPAEVREDVKEGLPRDGLDSEDNFTDTLETVQNEPPESMNNIEATTVKDSAEVGDLNEGLADDNVPQSAVKEIEDTNAAEKEPVQVADDASVGYGGSLFGFLGSALDSKEDDEEEDGEDMEREGAEDMEKLEGTDVEKEEGTAEKQDEIVRKEAVESAGDPSAEDVNFTGNLEVPETVNLKNEVFDSVKLPVGIEIDVGAEKDNNGSQQEDTFSNFTEKEGKLGTVEAERIVEASNFTEKQEIPDSQAQRIVESTLEKTQTEKVVDSKLGEIQPENIVESVEKVVESTLEQVQPEKIEESVEKVVESTLGGGIQPDKIVESVEKVDNPDLNVSGVMEGDNATEVVEPVEIGGTYEDKIGGVPKDEVKIGGMYSGVPKDEVKIGGMYSGVPKDEVKIGGMYGGVQKDGENIGGMYSGVPKDGEQIGGLYGGVPKDEVKIGGVYSGVPKDGERIGDMYSGVPKDGGKISDLYGGVPKDGEQIGGIYGGVPKDEEKEEEEGRGGRVKRDFMYQQNQYAYNTPPNYQQHQHNNYGGRMNDYNNNNYRQYRTDYPNAYAYQHQHGNMHHHNMESSMHHQNMYQSTQQPSKVEPSTVGTIKPSASVTSSQETLTTTEEPPVTDKQDYEEVTKKEDVKDVNKEQDYEDVIKKQDSEDISIEVDDHSGEMVTENVETSTEILPTSSEATISETVEVTDRPQVEIEEDKEHLTTQPPREEIIVNLDEEAESESGWFSMKAITDLFASKESVEDPKSTADDVTTSSMPSSEEEPKLTDGKCSSDDVACKLDNLEEKLLHGDLPSDPFISESDELLGALMDGLQKTSSGPIFCLIVTACAVVGFSLGYNFIENRKREGELVAKINSLEKANLVEKKEKNQLKDKLLHVSETSTLNTEAESSYLSQIAALTEEKNTLLAEKRDLEDQLMETERDLQTATESNLEMNNLLSESLSTPDGSTVLLETVDKTQGQIGKSEYGNEGAEPASQ
ncbi:uncharacterized protein LOC111060840 [Nilaparvata lugens]|uniref:uncharacterized protein LOC111060840 n=1 Tax=Nilaparvata lugens TaxID=108931 RepID=UPI00193E99DD|nr:uncharacterized protein LOC111060840 [Nilaparvata lugens]XP_039285231.1 uncharacterized protein LOC111060840 [Nilaparvata lugens]